MQKSVWTGGLAVLVLAGAIYLARSASVPPGDDGFSVEHHSRDGERASAGTRRDFGARDEGGSAGRGVGPAGGRRTGAAPGVASGSGGDLRERLAQARRVGGGGNIALPEPAAPDDSSEDRVAAGEAAPAPAGVGGGTGSRSQKETGTTGGAGPAGTELVPQGDVAPAVAFQSGEDKTFALESQVEIPDAAGKISTNSGSMSFWVTPGWGTGDQNDATFMKIGEDGLRIVKNVNFLRFEFNDADGIERGLGFDMGAWKEGEKHYVVANYSADGRSLQLYVDGMLKSQSLFPAGPNFGEKPGGFLGSNEPNPALGELSSIEIGGQPMLPDEVARRYADKLAPK